MIWKKIFKGLKSINDQFNDVEWATSGNGLEGPIFLDFLTLHYAKLRMLEIYFNFVRNFCGTDNYEKVEVDIDSLYLAQSEED